LARSSSGQSLLLIQDRELETPQKVEGLGPPLHCGDVGSNPARATNSMLSTKGVDLSRWAALGIE